MTSSLISLQAQCVELDASQVGRKFWVHAVADSCKIEFWRTNLESSCDYCSGCQDFRMSKDSVGLRLLAGLLLADPSVRIQLLPSRPKLAEDPLSISQYKPIQKIPPAGHEAASSDIDFALD